MTTPHMTRNVREQTIVWNAMKSIYKLLATQETQKIIHILLEVKEIRSTDLMKKANLSETQFHPAMRQLVKYCIIGKTVQEDRGVVYKLSPFGKNVLELSKPLLKEIKETLEEEQLIAN